MTLPEYLTGPYQRSCLLLKAATVGTSTARQRPLAMTHLPDIAASLDERLRGELVGYFSVSYELFHTPTQGSRLCACRTKDTKVRYLPTLSL